MKEQLLKVSSPQSKLSFQGFEKTLWVGHPPPSRLVLVMVTVPFNNMWTLKFKAQQTNVFFATINQMLAGSSQLSTAAERSNQIVVHSSDNEQGSAVVVSWEDPLNT